MNVLIIYSHPSKKSYTFQVLQQLIDALLRENHSIEISDLYSMNFASDMTEQEYEREGFSKTELPIPQEIVIEHEKIEKADCIIFLYPLWWSDCPAKMKGWFDRVYSVGYAYGYDNKGGEISRMKQIPLGITICTAGHPNEFLEEIGIANSIRNIMLDDRLGKRFEKKEMVILGGTLNLDIVRKEHSRKIIDTVKKLIL